MSTRNAYPSDLSDQEWARTAPLVPPNRGRGRQRHILVDTLGHLLYAWVHGADLRDHVGTTIVIGLSVRILPDVMSIRSRESTRCEMPFRIVAIVDSPICNVKATGHEHPHAVHRRMAWLLLLVVSLGTASSTCLALAGSGGFAARGRAYSMAELIWEPPGD